LLYWLARKTREWWRWRWCQCKRLRLGALLVHMQYHIVLQRLHLGGPNDVDALCIIIFECVCCLIGIRYYVLGIIKYAKYIRPRCKRQSTFITNTRTQHNTNTIQNIFGTLQKS
jgi:hypothetical protein